MKSDYLNVNGKRVLTTEVTFEDLKWLFSDFVARTGHAPISSECTIRNNLPQQRIIKKIIENQKIPYSYFLSFFGKKSHVRADERYYDFYVNEFIKISNKNNRTLTADELKNNPYGLPSANWFVKMSNSSSFDDFVKKCGFKSNKLKIDNAEELIKVKLTTLQEKLHRPLLRSDVIQRSKELGFSMIVVNRVFGSWGNCKEKLGLEKTPPFQPREFSFYKNVLDNALKNLSNCKRTTITWKDLEQFQNLNHKPITAAFARQGVDIYDYIRKSGFNMNPSSFAFRTILPNGERVWSNLEYIFSNHLRSLGFIYGKNYFKDVRYRDFTSIPNTNKSTCDYKVLVNNQPKYIEIAGIINKCDDNWRTHNYSSKQENQYRDKMIIKEKWLDASNVTHLFLFSDDFLNESYKQKVNEFLCVEQKDLKEI